MIQQHIFCGSSKKAYTAVGYIRGIAENRIDVALVMTKARVTLTKQISTPRMQLQAVVMGSRLGKTLNAKLEIKIVKQVKHIAMNQKQKQSTWAV